MTKETDYFKTFCKVSKAFGTTLKRNELLDLIVESAIETMDGKAASLFLSDEKKDVFVAVAHKGLSKNYFHAEPMKAKKVVANVLKGGHLSVRDATTDPRLENLEEKKAEGIASILVVPVMVKNKAIGVLSLYTASTRDFSNEEINFLSALADQGGMAIENSRLFERIKQNSALFLDLASNINSSLDVKDVLHNLTGELVKVLKLKGVVIRLLDEDSGTLKLVASHGLSDQYLNKGPVLATKSIAPALNGETVVIDDCAVDDRIQYKTETQKEGIVSMLCVPIKARDKVIGVMRLCSGVKRDFPEDTVTLVNAVAHQGGLAIQNASMYLKLQSDKESLEKEIWSHRQWF